MKILIIEDDEGILRNIQKILEQEQYLVDTSTTGTDGLYRTEIDDYDLVILDWMLPDIGGNEIIKILRGKKVSTPIMLLTARSQLEDKLEGFEAGADDYLTKPFEMKELLARVGALIRRNFPQSPSPLIKIGDLEINSNTCQVHRQGVTIQLAPKEYALLEYLARNPCTVIDRMSLMNHIWGDALDSFSNTVDVHISYLRTKIDGPYSKKLIKTVKNKGYMLCDQ